MSWQAGSRRDCRGRDATLLVLAFPFGNHSKVSPSILPRAEGPPRPASSPQVGPAGLRVGRAALYPRTWRLGTLEQPPRGCWGHPKLMLWPWGSPVAEVVTGFTLLCTPRAPFCPRAALGPVVCAGSPHDMALGAPPGTRGTWGRWLRAGGSPGCLGPEGRGFLSRDHPRRILRIGHMCRDTETRMGRTRREIRGAQRARGLQPHP